MAPVPNRDQVVSEINSRLVLLYPDGSELEINQDFQLEQISGENPTLIKLITLLTKHGGEGIAAKYIKEMKRLEWVDYEPSSDYGHFRFFPKGALVYSLLREWHERLIVERIGASEIRTPLLYDWSDEGIHGEAKTFFDRLYYVKGFDSKREFVLRFGGDFGLFRMLSDMKISHKNLPLRLYEFAQSFRYDRRGELKGLQRGRNFSFFDIHSVCRDAGQGWQEYADLFKWHADMSLEFGIDYNIEFTVIDEFYNSERDKIVSLAKYSKRPVIVEVLSKAKHYWAIKHIFHDEDGYRYFNAQLDFENSGRYGVTYTAADGTEQGCVICHCSSASIERWMLMVLERTLKMEKPLLPLWLSPTQIRIIPVNVSKHFDGAIELAQYFVNNRIRADVDDRNKGVKSRLRAAEEEWVPYVILFGDAEAGQETLSVRVRGKGNKTMTAGELIKEIHEQTSHMPFRQFGPLLMTRRPSI